MNQRSKRDVGAVIAIASMFLGAFVLPITWVGFVLVGGGALVMLVLLLTVVLEK